MVRVWDSEREFGGQKRWEGQQKTPLRESMSAHAESGYRKSLFELVLLFRILIVQRYGAFVKAFLQIHEKKRVRAPWKKIIMSGWT